ncbi:MAG: RNase A-like domain-containing protein [Hyphomicrobiaceae bacterium]
MPLPDSCPDCQKREAALLELRSGLAYIRLLVADLRLHLALKAGFNSDQPRDDHGRWTDTGGGSGGGGVRVAQANDVERYRVDLLEEEQKEGHTIAKHVRKTPETVAGYVRDSILADPDPTRHSIRSGSFPSVEAANKLVNSTLARNRAIVDGVATGILPEQRVDAFFDSPTGIEAYASTIRSQPKIRETYGVGVYIRQDPTAMRGYRVITAYPRNLD